MLGIIDGSSFLYRAHYANIYLTTKDGRHSGAIYGTLNMIDSFVHTYKPEHLCVVFDAKGENHRHKIYPLYKANRAKMPAELRLQIEPLHKAIKASGWSMLSINGVEADDTIASIVCKHQKDENILIATSDKDIAQLVNEKVHMVDTMKKIVLTPQKIKDKYGVYPNQIKDFLSLVGDSSDNIPGIRKCGAKTAIKWLEKYGSIKEIIKNTDNITGVIGENLKEGLEFLPTAYELVSLKKDVDINDSLENWTIKEKNKEILKKIYEEFELKTHLAKLDTQDNNNKSEKNHNYSAIGNKSQIQQHIKDIKKTKKTIVGIITDGKHYIKAKMIGFYYCFDYENSYFVPIKDDDTSNNEHLDEFKIIFQDKKIKKIVFNLKELIHILQNYNINLVGDNEDIQNMTYSINTTYKNANLNEVANSIKYKIPAPLTQIPIKDLTGTGQKKIHLTKVPTEKITESAGKKAILTAKIYQRLEKYIHSDLSILKIYKNIDTPLVLILQKMERIGAGIDNGALTKLSAEMTQSISILQQDIYRISGCHFNINSTKQLSDVLYNKMKIKIIKKTKTGAASTSEEVLQKLAEDYPLPKVVLKYRSLTKLQNTYIDKLPMMIDPQSKRIHTNYHQAVTSTGRLSSSNPNLQNIPIKSKMGAKIRSCFITENNKQILSADYSQIELRIMAHMSGDHNMITAFKQHQDIHRQTACEIFNLNTDEVTAKHRQAAKAINFGLIYGMGSFTLAKQINTSVNEAKIYIEKYFNRYSKVKQYMENMQESAKKNGFVQTILGRKIYINDIRSKNYQQAEYSKRLAINAPIQGSAAEIIKLAMINVDKYISDKNIANMIMQVHDELVFEVENKQITTFCQNIKRIMNNAYQLKVPLVTDIAFGKNWQIAHQ
jgi:DNA polymerase I